MSLAPESRPLALIAATAALGAAAVIKSNVVHSAEAGSDQPALVAQPHAGMVTYQGPLASSNKFIAAPKAASSSPEAYKITVDPAVITAAQPAARR